MRRRLLACAWLHDIAPASADWRGGVTVARALRRAGHEAEARIVAHAAGRAVAARLAGRPPLALEFPPPHGEDADAQMLLDAALLTTDPYGAPATPRVVVSAVVAARGPRDPGARGWIDLVARLADDADARRLVESLARAETQAVVVVLAATTRLRPWRLAS